MSLVGYQQDVDDPCMPSTHSALIDTCGYQHREGNYDYEGLFGFDGKSGSPPHSPPDFDSGASEASKVASEPMKWSNGTCLML